MNEAFQKYKKSGEILTKTLEYTKTIVKPGIFLLDIAEAAEKFIRNHSAEPAFPINISINEVAAHYSPTINDKTVIPEDSIVKIDAGVSIDGYLSDAARTIIFNEKWRHMKDTARKALDEALKIIKPNESVFRIGEIVQRCIEAEGFRSIINLSGHSLSQYSLHDGISIPNYKVSKKIQDNSYRFRIGKAYAIEPFVTTGVGRVTDSVEETIFRQFREITNKNLPKKTHEIYQYINNNFHRLPFSWRWIYNAGFSIGEINEAKKKLFEEQVIHGYPVLVEITKKPVTQEEETIFIGNDEVHIMTDNKKEK